MPMLSPSQMVHWIPAVLWRNRNKVLLLVLVTLEFAGVTQLALGTLCWQRRVWPKLLQGTFLLPPVGSWTFHVHLLDFLCTLLRQFGAVVACYSLITAKTGNVWWEVLRGIVLSFQRPVSLWLVENLASCSCWDYRWVSFDLWNTVKGWRLSNEKGG